MTSEEFLAEWRSPKPFITARTSGSTGSPKEIRLPKDLVSHSAQRTVDFFSLDSSSRLHLCLSPDYIAGKMMLVRAEISGAAISEEPPSNRPLAGFVAASPAIDLVAVVPSQMPHILLNLQKLPLLRNIIVGGSAIPPSIRQEIVTLPPSTKVYETYGMTETASHVALRRVSGDSMEPFSLLAGISMTLDAEGCARFVSDDFDVQTNDVVDILPGNCFRFVGRRDNAIVSGGIKIHPESVEAAIGEIPGNRRFYVTGKAHPLWGEIPVLVVEGPEMSEYEKNLLLKKIRPKCEGYGYPKEIVCIESFPLTPSGKIRRFRLS